MYIVCNEKDIAQVIEEIVKIDGNYVTTMFIDILL